MRRDALWNLPSPLTSAGLTHKGRKIYQKAPPTTAGLTHRGRKIYEKSWPVEHSISSDHSWINTKHYVVELSVFPDCSWDRDTGTEASMKHTALWRFWSSVTAAGLTRRVRKTYEKQRTVELSVFPECS